MSISALGKVRGYAHKMAWENLHSDLVFWTWLGID